MSLPRRSLLVKLALSPLIALLTLEASQRIYLRIGGRPYHGWATLQEMRELVGQMGGDLMPGVKVKFEVSNVPHPFLGWDSEGALADVLEDLAHSRERGHDECLDVLVVGSSVAAGFQNHGKETFIDALHRDPRYEGRPVHVLRYGRGAFKQPQQLMTVAWLLCLGLAPDAVVCIDGFNELVFALGNHRRNVFPPYPNIAMWAPLLGAQLTDRDVLTLLVAVESERIAAERWLRRVERFGIANSALLGTYALSATTAHHRAWVVAAEAFTDRVSRRADSLRGPVFDGDEDDALRLGIDTWSRATVQMKALLDARSIPLLSVLQPNPRVAGSKVLTEQEMRRSRASETWIDGAERGYEAIRQTGRELAECAGLHFADGTMVFHDVADTVWVDAGHLNEHGNALLGRWVGERLLEVLP